MSWVSLAAGIMKAANLIGEMVRNRQLMNAGAAKQQSKDWKASDERTKQARSAASVADHILIRGGDAAGRLRDKWSRD